MPGNVGWAFQGPQGRCRQAGLPATGRACSMRFPAATIAYCLVVQFFPLGLPEVIQVCNLCTVCPPTFHSLSN